MPNLWKLKLGFNAHAVDRHSTTIPVGIEHLSGLKEISAKIGGTSAEEPDGRSAESALSDAIRMHPRRPNVNIQCVDRMFGGKDDESSGTQEEEHMALQKQCEIMEQYEVQGPEPMLPAFLECGPEPFLSPGTSESQVTISGSIQQSATHQKRKTLPKWSTQVRVSSVQDIGALDDGFSWRKYGQKEILGGKYPRGYFRCTHRHTQGCHATKQVQRTDADPLLFDVVYHGTHTCTQNTEPQPGQEQSSVCCMPAGTETSCVTESSFVSPATLESQVTISDLIQGTTWHKERKALPKSSTRVSTLDDGFSWRKYGQKDTFGAKHPRGYYRCTHRNSRGCPATKSVQRTDDDPPLFDVVYHGTHTCTQRTHSHDESQQVTYATVSSSTAGVHSVPDVEIASKPNPETNFWDDSDLSLLMDRDSD